jgi:type II secretory pathway component GspD/PulD (secretin)
LRLQIGYTLTVTPRAGAADDITLDLAPRVSTVDEIEVGSGLPTLGIREANSVVRVQPGDAVILGGLDADLAFQTRGRSLPSRIPLLGRLFRSRRSSRSQTATLLLVTARKV